MLAVLDDLVDRQCNIPSTTETTGHICEQQWLQFVNLHGVRGGALAAQGV